MAIFYYKLWDLLERKNITQRELVEQLNISTATLTKMRKNQTVSLETLDLIREYLECDYGDIITAIPSTNEVDVNWGSEKISTQVNHIYRLALRWYMEQNGITVQSIVSITTLALNTVKDFLRGKDLSSRSIVKLMRLGDKFNCKVDELLTQNDVKNKVYCNRRCGRHKTCFGLRYEYHAEINEYTPYCYLNFEIIKDKNGDLIASNGCPHPKNTRELGLAIEKYGAHQRGEVEHIPVKDEKDSNI